MRSQYTPEDVDATDSEQGSDDSDKRDEQESAAQQPQEEDKAEEGVAATRKKLQGEDEDERYQDLAAATPQMSMTVEEHMALAEQSYALGSEADKQVALQHFQVAAGNAIGRLF